MYGVYRQVHRHSHGNVHSSVRPVGYGTLVMAYSLWHISYGTLQQCQTRGIWQISYGILVMAYYSNVRPVGLYVHRHV